MYCDKAETELTTEIGMVRKKKFEQLPLWMLPKAPDGVELSASKQRELRPALAELLWQFASLSAERETSPLKGRIEEENERYQDHA